MSSRTNRNTHLNATASHRRRSSAASQMMPSGMASARGGHGGFEGASYRPAGNASQYQQPTSHQYEGYTRGDAQRRRASAAFPTAQPTASASAPHSPLNPNNGALVTAPAPDDSVFLDQQRAARAAAAVALRSVEREAAEAEEEGEGAAAAAREALASALPPGAHVPEFRIVPLIPTPGAAASTSETLADASGRPLGRHYSPWRGRISFAIRLAIAIVAFALSIATAVEMTNAKLSIEESRRRLTTACGSSTLL